MDTEATLGVFARKQTGCTSGFGQEVYLPLQLTLRHPLGAAILYSSLRHSCTVKTFDLSEDMI